MSITYPDDNKMGQEIHRIISDVFPLCRSITGSGVRKTLQAFRKYINLDIHEVPSGQKVYDWEVPQEWEIVDAYIASMDGARIIDFNKSNLHVASYSQAVDRTMSWEELEPHVITLPEYPDRIPYRTFYYCENWAFCVSHEQFQVLSKGGPFLVCIESKLKKGSLSYGEFLIKGESSEEIVFSTYICHPSMCNDNLTGPALMVKLAEHLMNCRLKYSYRFLFVPETIGAIVWLSRNEKHVERIKGGLVATCLGDRGGMTYKKTKDGDSYIDRVVLRVLKDSAQPYQVVNFFPMGSDERQYCSPGFNLPFGALMRTMYGRFSEYHTSADNLDFVTAEHLGDSFRRYLEVVETIESDGYWMNNHLKCEPRLGVRGLYRKIGTGATDIDEEAIFWVLSLSDGKHSLLDIANRSGSPFRSILTACEALKGAGLLVGRIN